MTAKSPGSPDLKQLKPVMVAIREIRIADYNPRQHSEHQINLLAKSMDDYGFTRPIVIDRDNVILAGHGRLEAAKQLGMTEVPCVRADHLDEPQARAFALADNALSDMALWDDEAVRDIIAGMKEHEVAFLLDKSRAESHLPVTGDAPSIGSVTGTPVMTEGDGESGEASAMRVYCIHCGAKFDVDRETGKLVHG